MESGAAPRFTRILLTGPPGIGKTTVCKKCVSHLNSTKYKINGFYTEEIRSTVNKNRIGFDVVSLGNSHGRKPLARISDHLEGRRASKARVGNYHVFIDEFESMALSVFNLQSDVLLIDEIGKMELFSKKFQDNVEKIFFSEEKAKICVIATIPQKHKVPGRFTMFFEKLYNDENCKVIEVNRQNRDNLPETIVRMTEEILS